MGLFLLGIGAAASGGEIRSIGFGCGFFDLRQDDFIGPMLGLGEGKRVPIVVRVPSWNRNAVKEIPH